MTGMIKGLSEVGDVVPPLPCPLPVFFATSAAFLSAACCFSFACCFMLTDGDATAVIFACSGGDMACPLGWQHPPQERRHGRLYLWVSAQSQFFRLHIQQPSGIAFWNFCFFLLLSSFGACAAASAPLPFPLPFAPPFFSFFFFFCPLLFDGAAF